MDGPERKLTRIADVVEVLNGLTGGRLVRDLAEVTAGSNHFVVTKDSGVPGKAVTEIPGLVWGRPEQPVRRIAVVMSCTECVIELANALGVELIVAHHPVADAASSGGVPFGTYLSLYGISLIEAHEALHGLHPGIAWLHGHQPFRLELNYGGIPGNVIEIGRPLPGVRSARDIVERLTRLMGFAQDSAVLAAERRLRAMPGLAEAALAVPPQIYSGSPDAPVACILHIHPHTGFSAAHLQQVVAEHSEIDLVLTSISRVSSEHPLVSAARGLGLSFVAGNTHALEIFENGLPLAYALEACLPGIEVLLFRERVTAMSARQAAGSDLQAYARAMAEGWLLPRARGTLPQTTATKPNTQEGESA